MKGLFLAGISGTLNCVRGACEEIFGGDGRLNGLAARKLLLGRSQAKRRLLEKYRFCIQEIINNATTVLNK